MPIIPAPASPTHDLGDTRFTALASPSRGSAETSVWIVEIDPGTPATPHRLTREEVFVVLDGAASVRIGDAAGTAAAGDAVVVPPGADFEIAASGDTPLRMVCCLPIGGQARIGDATFTPPWAE